MSLLYVCVINIINIAFDLTFPRITNPTPKIPTSLSNLFRFRLFPLTDLLFLKYFSVNTDKPKIIKINL